LHLGTETAFNPFLRLVEEFLLNFEPTWTFDARVNDHQLKGGVSGAYYVFECFPFPVCPDFLLPFFPKGEPHFIIRPFLPGDLFEFENVAFFLKFACKLTDACPVKALVNLLFGLAEEGGGENVGFRILLPQRKINFLLGFSCHQVESLSVLHDP
jgi:hypothetical protein